MLKKFKTDELIGAWWIGYCDGGKWPVAVYVEGLELIKEQFKK